MNLGLHLKLKIVRYKKDKVKFQIRSQSERLRNKTVGGSFIKKINGINIISAATPQVIEHSNEFFIRGRLKSEDDRIITASNKFFNKLQKSISEINSVKCIY